MIEWGAGLSVRDRKKQGCFLRAYRDVLTACPGQTGPQQSIFRTIGDISASRKFEKERTESTEPKTSSQAKRFAVELSHA